MRLATEFNFSHADIGRKMGKSREFVSNSLRMLQMPQEIIDALSAGKINEGHTRPILMLNDRPEEQAVLFKEIVYKKMTVREAERIARTIAKEKVRKQELLPDPEIEEIENKLKESLGTRVHIDRKQIGGKITIDFFSDDDLKTLLEIFELHYENGKMLSKPLFPGKKWGKRSCSIQYQPRFQRDLQLMRMKGNTLKIWSCSLQREISLQ
jgi:hypothetical protein